jgi:hypothetical protein
MEIEFSLELVENLIAGIDVKVFAPVGTPGNKCDEVGVLPDDPTLPPVAAVFIDPLLKVKSFKVREHKASLIVAAQYRVRTKAKSRRSKFVWESHAIC